LLEKLKNWPDARLVGAQQQDAAMAPGWMVADVTESLVGSYQAPLLGLNRLPQGIVLRAAHSLLDHAYCLVPMASKHLYGCSGQILIYLEAHGSIPRPAMG